MGVIEIAPAELKKCVLPLLAVTEQAEWTPIGTCFIVAVLDALKADTPVTYVHGRIESFALAGTPIVQSPGMFLSCALPFGMSAGPVIELRGSTPIVRGVVSSDMGDMSDGDGSEGETRAFASHPLPIAGVPLAGLPTLRLEDGAQLVAPTLVELAAKGLVKDPRGSFEHVAVAVDGERVIITWCGPAPSDD